MGARAAAGSVVNRGMNNVWALIAASAAIYAALALIMGVAPGVTLSGTPATAGAKPLNAQQQHGRDIYVSEGCAYCHTQNVRPLKQDLIFGRPSVGGDYAYDTPELLGDHRNGPDLSNIGARQPSAVWQYIHLYNPRAVVQGSIMPRYSWLFAVEPKAQPGDVIVPMPQGFAPRGVVVATKDAQDLVAYLQALKQLPLGVHANK